MSVEHEATERMDLGALNGPVLVFGGPYSNLHATRALKAEAESWAFRRIGLSAQAMLSPMPRHRTPRPN